MQIECNLHSIELYGCLGGCQADWRGLDWPIIPYPTNSSSRQHIVPFLNAPPVSFNGLNWFSVTLMLLTSS